MSKLRIDVPNSELRWWRLRLPTNDDGNVMFLTHNGVYDVEGENMITPPTQVVYEFFDGIDADITGVVGCATEKIGHRFYLLLLCDHAPTTDPGWEALEPVRYSPPFRPARGYDDIPMFQVDRDFG